MLDQYEYSHSIEGRSRRNILINGQPFRGCVKVSVFFFFCLVSCLSRNSYVRSTRKGPTGISHDEVTSSSEIIKRRYDYNPDGEPATPLSYFTF
jgi:hypothetical protein